MCAGCASTQAATGRNCWLFGAIRARFLECFDDVNDLQWYSHR